VPTLTIPLRRATAGSLPSGESGITAGGGSPGKLQGSTDRCRVEGARLPSTQATRGAGFAVAESIRRRLSAQTCCALLSSIQAEHRTHDSRGEARSRLQRPCMQRCLLVEPGSPFGPANGHIHARLSRWHLLIARNLCRLAEETATAHQDNWKKIKAWASVVKCYTKHYLTC